MNQKMTFKPNWIWREVVTVEVIWPAPLTGKPITVKMVLFAEGGAKLA
jgi:hypothetical protein